jgi:hypothetical protein
VFPCNANVLPEAILNPDPVLFMVIVTVDAFAPSATKITLDEFVMDRLLNIGEVFILIETDELITTSSEGVGRPDGDQLLAVFHVAPFKPIQVFVCANTEKGIKTNKKEIKRIILLFHLKFVASKIDGLLGKKVIIKGELMI